MRTSRVRPALAALTLLSTTAAVAGSTGAAEADHRRVHHDAVRLYTTHVRPLGHAGGATISGEAFGSAITRVPGTRAQVYGLTDRGPNVDGPDDSKIEPLPDFTPAIARFRLTGGKARLLQRIPLKGHDGTRYEGQVNTVADTGETITDLDGNALPASRTGYDPEGLVAMPNGTFWVSDEYGPFITHFNRHGRQIGRLSPYAGTLPTELRNRGVNRGMEGLTLAHDGHTLVGVMQSALDQPDLTAKFKNVSLVRIVTHDLRSGRDHEYAYLLDDPKDTGTAVSEIAATGPHRFVVLERDGDFEPGAYKKLFTVDTSEATDIGPASTVPGTTYDASAGGLLHDGKTLEETVGDTPATDAADTLQGIGITPMTKRVRLDLGALVTGIDPSGGFFGHDKVEGVAVFSRGKRLLVSNDNDFGISGITNDAPPFQLATKTLPDGRQDDGEMLMVHVDRLRHLSRR